MEIPQNQFTEGEKALVGIEESEGDIAGRVKTVVDAIGGIERVIEKGDSVLLKPNYVFAKAPPCTTATDFLQAVIRLCFEAGADDVVVGESAAYWVNTREVMNKMGALDVIEEEGARAVSFDEEEWVTVELESDVIKDTAFPQEAFNHDTVIFLPNMKTHHIAAFTLSLKLAYGLLSTKYRTANLHFKNIQQKIAAVNKAVHPDLVIMDGRKAFVDGGPSEGELTEPNLLLASGDRVAIDAVAVNKLREHGADLDDPFSYGQIAHAAELGLGVGSEEEIETITA